MITNISPSTRDRAKCVSGTRKGKKSFKVLFSLRSIKGKRILCLFFVVIFLNVFIFVGVGALLVFLLFLVAVGVKRSSKRIILC